MDLSGKCILVTGGGGIGVGAGVCRAVMEAGGQLALNEREREKANKAASDYDGAVPIAGDISKPEEVAEIFHRVEAEVGTLHGLVNNAGIGLSRLAHRASEEEFDKLQAVDFRGVWLMARAFARHMLQRKEEGSIVNITSVHARSTLPRYAIYAGAKSGVEGLTRGLAVELGAHNIRCNAVAPGYVHSEQNLELLQSWTDDPEGWVEEHTTNQQALEYEISAEDCGRAVVFLLSEASRCITGQVLTVDCGTTAMLYNKDFVS